MSARASQALCDYVRSVAPPHYATADAPSTWSALRRWYDVARAQGFPRERIAMPVYNGGCESTIYPDAETNHAFRAWHDYTHCANGYGFTREHEIKVGLIHMQQARRAGLPQSDLDMLIADTIGQIEYYYAHGCYVDNQSAFVAAVLRDGLRTVIDSGARF